jgi:hypothetical protein
MDVKLMTNLHLLPRLRMSGSVPLLALFASWLVHGELNLYFDTVVRNTQNVKIFMVNIIQ